MCSCSRSTRPHDGGEVLKCLGSPGSMPVPGPAAPRGQSGKPIGANGLARRFVVREECPRSLRGNFGNIGPGVARMLARLHAQLHEVRLDLRRRRLRHRERRGLRRLGEEAARAGSGGSEAFERLVAEIAEGERRAAALVADGRASLDADRADLRAVAVWVKPAVLLRGLCTRLVLRHRRSLERRALRPRFEALGELVAESNERGADAGSIGREVAAARDQLAAVTVEREWRGAPYGGRAMPDWTAGAAAEAVVFGSAVLTQLRSHVLPKAPAIAGLAVGWWIANTYTDSHLRSALRSVGIGSGGTRVVSSSTYESMTFWLPLLAAALCAYLGERLGAYYRGRAAADT
jgi:hypothetical protein